MSASQVANSEATPQAAAAVDVIKGGEEDEDEDEEFEVYETIDDVPMKIQPGLFLGSCLAEGNLEALQQCGITHVLQVAEGMQPSHPETLQYQQIHVQDLPSEDLVAHFPKCFQHIDDALSTPSGGVLVHCVAGVSRSATVVMGYLMWKERLGYDEAFRRVHSVRPWVMPNEGFRQQLREFEKLGFDLSRWKAWRHTWKEDPLTLHLSSFATAADADDVESAWDSLMR